MSAVLATKAAPNTPDLRRITEEDPDYQQLHATTVARLQRSVRQYAREVQRGDPGADTRFINRHIALMRQAYEAAHHAGQKDYWPAVSTRTVQHRFVAADPEQANKRLTYYALGSVLKMAHEVKAYQAAQKTATLDESIHLAAPADIPGSFDNRVALQGQIVWSGLQDGYSDAGASDSASPYAALYWNLGPVKTEHCGDCPDLAFGSPYDPPWAGAGSNQLTQSPGDGQTECGAACKCSLSYEYPSGDALEQLNQAIADRWTQFMADGSGLPTISNGAMPAKGTVLTPLQRGYMDEYRNAQDAWEEARGSLPAAPGMFNGGDWTGAKLTPWGAMTPYQQNIIARMEQVQIDWLHAAGELNWPTPAYTPDQETAIMGWLRKASQSSRWVDPPYIPSSEQQSLSWLSDVAAANLWPEPPVGDQESAMMAWLRDVAKRMQWGTPADGSSQQMQEAIDSIKLYNPNHDARGRFTTGSGASTTVARGQGRTRRGEGGRRVRNTPSQAAPAHAASSSGSAGSGSGSASESPEVQSARDRYEKAQEVHQKASDAYQRAQEAQQAAQERADRAVAASDVAKEAALATQHAQALEQAQQRSPRAYEKWQQAQQRATEKRAYADKLKADPNASEDEIAKAERVAQRAESSAHYQEESLAFRNQYGRGVQSWLNDPAYRTASDEVGNANRALRAANNDLTAARDDVATAQDAVDAASAQLRAAQGGTAFTVRYNNNIGTPDGAETTSNIFGRTMTDDELGKLAGAQPGDNVIIEATNANNIDVGLTGPNGHDANFTVTRMENGDIVVSNTYVRNRGQKTSGSGADVIQAFDDMSSLGVTRLEASAAKGPTFNGYYTWARLGFTGNIPGSVLPAARAAFGNVRTVQDLMQKGPVAQRWWKVNGTAWQATFSFKPGSYSMRTLNAWRGMVNRNG